MDLTTGVKHKSSTRRTRTGGRSRSVRRTRRRAAQAKKTSLPRTAVLQSRKSRGYVRVSRATSGMSLTELQFMAKDRGIPFGGLSRAKLVKKINNYMF